MLFIANSTLVRINTSIPAKQDVKLSDYFLIGHAWSAKDGLHCEAFHMVWQASPINHRQRI